MNLVVWIIGMVVVIGLTHGAVLDLVNLVHQYEDEILGRRVGHPGIREQDQLEDESEKMDDVGELLYKICLILLLN